MQRLFKHPVYIKYLVNFFLIFSEKETGKEYAAKIIDVNESKETGVLEATRREVEILRLVAGHPYISKILFCF